MTRAMHARAREVARRLLDDGRPGKVVIPNGEVVSVHLPAKPLAGKRVDLLAERTTTMIVPHGTQTIHWTVDAAKRPRWGISVPLFIPKGAMISLVFQMGDWYVVRYYE